MVGELTDYADDDDVGMLAYHNEIASSDDDVHDPAATLRSDRQIEGAAGPAGLLRARQGTMGNDSFIEGFVRGEMDRESDLPGLQPPPAPRGGGPPRGQHVFARPCRRWYGAPRAGDDPAAAEASEAAVAEAPSDAALKARIDMHAAMVARGGDDVAELARRTHAGALPSLQATQLLQCVCDRLCISRPDQCPSQADRELAAALRARCTSCRGL